MFLYRFTFEDHLLKMGNGGIPYITSGPLKKC